MAKPDLGRIDIQRLGRDLDSWKQGLAEPTARAIERVEGYLKNQLTIADNMMASIREFTVTHGQELPFKSPSFAPRGFTVLESVDATTGAPVQVVGAPYVNRQRPDRSAAWYGLTVRIAPPQGVAQLHKSANQPTTNAVIANVTFDINVAVGGDLSHSTTSNTDRVVCAKDGFVEVFYDVEFAFNSTGERLTYITKNGGSRHGTIRLPAHPANVWQVSAGGIWQVSAGDYIGLAVYQTSGGTLDVIGGGGDGNSTRLQVRYCDGPVNQSVRVTGILWGG